MWAGSLHSHCRRWGSSQRGRRSRGSDLSHCKADSYVWSVNHSLYAHISVRWILSLKLGEMNLTPKSFSSFLYLLLSFQCAITLNQLPELAIASIFLHLQLNHHKLIHLVFIFQIPLPNWSQTQNLPTLPQFHSSPLLYTHLSGALRPSSSSNFHIKLFMLFITANSLTWLPLSDCDGNTPHFCTVFSFPIQISWNISSGELLSIQSGSQITTCQAHKVQNSYRLWLHFVYVFSGYMIMNINRNYFSSKLLFSQ